MKYIELCAGVGGTRAGLDQAGWTCEMAIDIDKDAVAVHRACFGHAEHGNVLGVDANELPDFEALVAGFPCQPFSSSGPRLGFEHPSGNVFDSIARIAAVARPKTILLENVRGLLNHRGGSTFINIIATLTSLDYHVDWFLLDLSWLNVPQTRPRVFIIARDRSTVTSSGRTRGAAHPAEQSAFQPLLARLDIEVGRMAEGVLTSSLERQSTEGICSMGSARGSTFWTWDARRKPPEFQEGMLGGLVAPEFRAPELVRSVRFYARGKGTQLHVRGNALAHCVGNIPGSAPMFCVPLKAVTSARDKKSFLDGANWHREEGEHLVMRLKPEAAIRLFGPHVERISEALSTVPMTLSKKYILVANLVAPVCSAAVGRLVAGAAFE